MFVFKFVFKTKLLIAQRRYMVELNLTLTLTVTKTLDVNFDLQPSPYSLT